MGNWLEYRARKALSGYIDSRKSIIWDDDKSPTADPQIAHKLSRMLPIKFVDKLCISFMLLRCNDATLPVAGLYAPGFLPTMKLQLSQLP